MLAPLIRTLALATAAFACAALPATAHETFLQSMSPQPQAGSELTLALSSTGTFPVQDFAIRPERVAIAKLRIANKISDLTNLQRSLHALTLRTTPRTGGLATVWVQLAPLALELAPDKIDEYFDEINASPQLRNTWRTRPDPKIWRETYTKHAKTFLQIGADNGDQSWNVPVKLGLEIIPLQNPLQLKVGDTLAVQALTNGVPLCGLQVGSIDSEGHSNFQQTDNQGRANFKLVSAGAWLLRATDLRPSTEHSGEWQSDFTTLTLDIAQR